MPSRPPKASMMAKGVAAHAAKVRHDVKRSVREDRAWYKTAAWRQIRAAHLAIEPLCRMCRANGVLNDGSRKVDGTYEPDLKRQGLIVDHIEPHRGDREKFFGGPFQTLCHDHHDRVKQREEIAAVKAGGKGLRGSPRPEWLRPSIVPVVIVCGPPMSGKSTYVQAHAGERDLIIDLDVIASKLSGQPAHGWDRRWLDTALRVRNDLLADLGRLTSWPRAWLIVSEPTAEGRQWWADKIRPQRIVVIEAPQDVCMQRLQAATDRPREWTSKAIASWWSAYESRRGDEVVGQG